MRRFSSVYRLKREIPSMPMLQSNKLIATDFPFDVNGNMQYVFTEFKEESVFSPIGIFSIILTKEQVEEYLEYVEECLPQYS